MTTHITTWKIPPAAWLMVGLAVAAEGTSNALRAYELGSHLERLTVTVYGHSISLAGAVLVLAAIAVSLSQTRAAWVALTPGDTRQRIVSGIAAALLLSISITAMATHILGAQRAKSGAETQDRTGYVDAKAAYDKAVAEADKVASADTVEQVEAQIAAIAAKRIDPNIWRKTAKCTDVTKPASQKECAPIAELAPARAAAKRKAELEAQIPGLKADVERFHFTEEASAPEETVSGAWAWIMGLGVVMIATFGPAIFARVETVQVAETTAVADPVAPAAPAKVPAKTAPAKPLPPQPPRGGRRGRKVSATVISFSDMFREKHGRPITGSELRAQFPEMPVSTAYDYADRARKSA